MHIQSAEIRPSVISMEYCGTTLVVMCPIVSDVINFVKVMYIYEIIYYSFFLIWL